MKTIGSDYQDLVKETSSEVVPVKVDFKLLVDICGKMFNNSRLALPLISVVTTLTMLASHSEALALERGDNNSEVKNVQSCLKRLGYFNGPVNGNFASMTESAVRRFQQVSGISAIGKVGPQTLAALQRKCGSSIGEGGGDVSDNACTRGLRSGCDGAPVTKLQEDLKALGVYNGPVTGRFRELTTNAVISFQRQNGINPIGIVGPRTREAMRLALNAAPRQEETNLPGRFCDYNREIISIGCRGEWISQLQQRLKDLNYFSGNPTGYFGPVTRDAVARFQQDNRLPTTGNVDKRTWVAMNSQIISPSPSPLPIGVITVGARGPQVTTLQQNLKTLNYFYGNPTGFFDKSTQDAVMRFQQSYGLPMTGNLDSRTSQAISTVLRSQGGDRAFEEIYPGDNNERVTKVQERLLELGLLKANPTGYFGPFTRQGLLAFQRYQGLSETGFVDEQTWTKLG
ncbi:MAG: peptidoglycan-binding protein, partial [Rivularia sp. (in: cyanobacteria)]